MAFTINSVVFMMIPALTLYVSAFAFKLRSILTGFIYIVIINSLVFANFDNKCGNKLRQDLSKTTNASK